MTAKEKAFHLHFKYIREVIADNDKAKKCALIAVDELLHYSKAHGFIELTKFHEEVKQEIEKL
jgi:hypothetical protein